MSKIAMLGTGLIGGFYTTVLMGMRSRDQVQIVCAASEGEARTFAEKWGAFDVCRRVIVRP